MTTPKSASVEEDAPRRRPYEPPAIEETSEFETLALSCTTMATPLSCENENYVYHNS